jgi:hypothetical protein
LRAARIGEQRKGARSAAGAGGRVLWLLSFGQAKESNSPVGARPDQPKFALPGCAFILRLAQDERVFV